MIKLHVITQTIIKEIQSRRRSWAPADQRGSAGIWLLFAIFAILIIILIISEYIRWINVRELVISDLDRTMNVAVEASMMDAYRSDSESYINTDIVEQSFYHELHDSMQLNVANQRIKADGTVLFALKINDLRIHAESARIELEADANIPTLFGRSITVPIELITKNGRLD